MSSGRSSARGGSLATTTPIEAQLPSSLGATSNVLWFRRSRMSYTSHSLGGIHASVVRSKSRSRIRLQSHSTIIIFDFAMPVKRPHKKSRYGCDQCRKRHVKCDEKPPRCANCIQRNETCHFSRQAPPWMRSDTPHVKSSPSAGSQPDYSPLTDPGTSASSEPSRSANDAILLSKSVRLRELALMHHWCTRTCYSFTDQTVDLFRDHVAKEALRHEYLMAALFALTSVHIACETVSEDPATAREHVSTGLQYQNQALVGLHEVLGTITSENCDTILVTSVLIMVCSIVAPLLPTGLHDQAQSTAEFMLPLVGFLRGIGSIVKLSRHWLVQGPASGILGNEQRKLEPIHKSLPFQELRQLNDKITDVEKHQIYENAIEKLVECSHKGKSVVPWLVMAGPEFMDELIIRDSVALAIFIHWGALLDQLDTKWWAKYSGRRLVEDVSAELHARGDEWKDVTRWCRKQVGLSDE